MGIATCVSDFKELIQWSDRNDPNFKVVVETAAIHNNATANISKNVLLTSCDGMLMALLGEMYM